MTGRLVLLSTSPRVAPGLLTWQAWEVLRSADVLAGTGGHPLLPYLDAAGIEVSVVGGDAAGLASHLVQRAAASERPVVWLADADDALDVAVATAVVSAQTPPPELEVLPGSYDLPGARLLDLVAVMDRLRSPGGCPWDAEQTHQSLVTYVLEEAYETIEAIETGDREHLREELGDLLLQVVFHARIAAEDPEQPWDVDDVAEGIVTKLVRRHPHVFGDADAPSAAHVEASWERLKAAEKGRASVFDGIPPSLPALALAAKTLARAERAGLAPSPEAAVGTVGERLFLSVQDALASGVDPEAALRLVVRDFVARARAAESRKPPGQPAPKPAPRRPPP
jgi:XTP/dITP diphosphohydrolase